MIGYHASPASRHPLRSTDAREAIRMVERMLVQATDCGGPSRVAGVPIDRLASVECTRGDGRSTLPALRELIDELVRDRRPCRVELALEMRLRVPDAPPSALSVKLHHRNLNEVFPRLWWPYDTVTDGFLRSHDDVFGELGIATDPACWCLGAPDRQDHVAFAFERSAFSPPPTDEVGRRLHDGVLASPDDAGARLAYGDWLAQQGDPLGEMLVVQVELASATGERLAALEARAAELLGRYGLRWPQILVPREAPPRELRDILRSLGLPETGQPVVE